MQIINSLASLCTYNFPSSCAEKSLKNLVWNIQSKQVFTYFAFILSTKTISLAPLFHNCWKKQRLASYGWCSFFPVCILCVHYDEAFMYKFHVRRNKNLIRSRCVDLVVIVQCCAHFITSACINSDIFQPISLKCLRNKIIATLFLHTKTIAIQPYVSYQRDWLVSSSRSLLFTVYLHPAF